MSKFGFFSILNDVIVITLEPLNFLWFKRDVGIKMRRKQKGRKKRKKKRKGIK